MNEQPPVQSHVRFIVGSVTILAGMSMFIGGFLLWKGFAGGELLCSQAGVAIGGLLGMLSQGRQPPPSGNPPTTATVTTP